MAAKETGLFRPHAHPFWDQRCSLKRCWCAGQVGSRTWGSPQMRPVVWPSGASWPSWKEQVAPGLGRAAAHASLAPSHCSHQFMFLVKFTPACVFLKTVADYTFKKRRRRRGAGNWREEERKESFMEGVLRPSPAPHCWVGPNTVVHVNHLSLSGLHTSSRLISMSTGLDYMPGGEMQTFTPEGVSSLVLPP